MVERFTAEEVLDKLDCCGNSGSEESDFEDSRLFPYIGTSTGEGVALTDTEDIVNTTTFEDVDNTKVLEDTLNSLSDATSSGCSNSKLVLFPYTIVSVFAMIVSIIISLD